MDSDEKTLISLLSHIYLQNARPDKAMVLLEALDAIAPGDPQTLGSLALAQVRAGKPALALDTLDHLAMHGGADPAFHLLRAQALVDLERLEDAAAAMAAFHQLRGHFSGDPPP